MSLLKDFLRIDADRRGAHETLRAEAAHRRTRIDELASESRRKRDEIAMLEEGLHRLTDDVARVEQEILDLDKRREEHDGEAKKRKAAAVRSAYTEGFRETARVAQDFRVMRTEFHQERERLLAQADTGRMMDNFFQIETFLKSASQPIPDAARKALQKERMDLVARIGPLVAPPPSPDAILRATVTYSGLSGGDEPHAIVAFGMPEPETPSGPTDLVATLLYGAYATAVERLGPAVPRPSFESGMVLFDMPTNAREPEEAALELFLAVEEGMKKAANAVSVRCELTGVFVEPEIARDVFGG
ncbi:MAG: hypothetical protein JNK60_13655 [Acidobacteria bacterium]|nr:hypothetical protein [Acidobacteriota bacterium]